MGSMALTCHGHAGSDVPAHCCVCRLCLVAAGTSSVSPSVELQKACREPARSLFSSRVSLVLSSSYAVPQ